jgi:hypothetical protein
MVRIKQVLAPDVESIAPLKEVVTTIFLYSQKRSNTIDMSQTNGNIKKQLISPVFYHFMELAALIISYNHAVNHFSCNTWKLSIRNCIRDCVHFRTQELV